MNSKLTHYTVVTAQSPETVEYTNEFPRYDTKMCIRC